jgi:hypothetical protein
MAIEIETRMDIMRKMAALCMPVAGALAAGHSLAELAAWDAPTRL